MRVPTVKMYKGSRTITVNEIDTLRYAKIGWSLTDDSTKPTGQKKQDEQPESKSTTGSDDILLDTSAE